MPPKKKDEPSAAEANVLLLGRLGTSLKIGIVGLPNVGYVFEKSSDQQNYIWCFHMEFANENLFLRRKSTFFNCLTQSQAAAENFPFCTIEPNEARINVPDERFDWLCQLYKPKSEVGTANL